jgi:hypothetical protein
MTNACEEPARCLLRGLGPRSSTNSWSTSLYSYAGSYNNLQAGELVPLKSGKLALDDCDMGGTFPVRNYDGASWFSPTTYSLSKFATQNGTPIGETTFNETKISPLLDRRPATKLRSPSA